ncbi:zinc finger protein 804B isoform X1 [Excalfactoria chinensis]|uniref:zinc finger protein 804B isoform X1 n=1 Tax=Excalfactoria chinensis TaxID=46218 RepID=UPI003B3B3D38
MCCGCCRPPRIALLLAALGRPLDEPAAGRSLPRFRPLLHAGSRSAGGSAAAAAEERAARPGPRMACYLVISSRHLSNGHYRGIKGVFRGPLCKNGARSPVTAASALSPSLAPRTDYAEKEKAAAKALEDVKANFYCELCDKQYHKHQEFDNHINSYDHAHKQRLKDLKQREFARNVASKSWKDEKKQEKALKRLHQLAELRKQSGCIAGSGPTLKTPRLVVEKQQSPDAFFLYKGGKVTTKSQSTTTSTGQSFSSSILEKQQLISRHQSSTERLHVLGNQVSQVFPNSSSASQRAGVSFSFSKKVPLKLESSASVFSENSEEGNDYSESPNHKTKQNLESFRSGVHLEEDVKASLDKGPPIPQDQTNLDNSASNHGAMKPKMLKGNDKCSVRETEEKVSAHPSLSKVKMQFSNLDFSGSVIETEQESKLNVSEQLLETLISPSHQAHSICIQSETYKHSNAHLSELPQQPAPELTCASNINDCPRVVKGETSLEASEIKNRNMENLPREAVVKEAQPQALPFLHVVSKDGSTALQWPTELLLFTKTEPCISYGCNPLYFDFRLSLNHRDGKQHETSKEGCKEHSTNKTMDENEASGLIKHKQTSNEQDNQLLKPKKMKDSLNPRKAKQKAKSDIGKEMNKNGQKYISDYLNENIPKVPAYLDVSQKDSMAEKGLHRTTLKRSLRHHFHSCERKKQNIRNESISFSAFMARIKKSKTEQCDLIYSEEKHETQNGCRSIQNFASCSSDISDSGKDSGGSFLSCKSGLNSRHSENEGYENYARCWRFPSPQKSSFDRLSSYSDTSVSSTSSYMSSSSSPTLNNHSRNHSLFCCKRKTKTAERHKCKHRKHNSIFTSDDADKDYLCHTRSHRSRNCTQRGTIKYQKCSRHKVLQHRDGSKHSRCRHRHFGKVHSRSYNDPKSSSTTDSRSSERSSCSRISRESSAGSFSNEYDNYANKTREDTCRDSNINTGKAEIVSNESLNVDSQSKAFATCSSETSTKDVCGRRKSLTAKLLLERVQSKKIQEQAHDSERFANTFGREMKDLSQSHFALQFSSSVDDTAMLPLPEKLLSIGKNDIGQSGSLLEINVKKTKCDDSEITHVALSTGTDYDHCLFKDIVQIGTSYQNPSIKRNTAIKEQSNLFINEVQPFIQSCDPVPNDFPGAFPSKRYSVVANSTETKEELHDVNMDSNRAEGSLDSLCDNAMQKYNDTVDNLEVYSKSISPPLMQQPIMFSPEEVDKYRLLQLQAQQHMQKQLLAKHLQVLPAPGPAAFSATPAVPAIPVQQHATVTTIHHTLLQRFAVSASVHPHGSHLSLAHLHPLSQAHFAPISLSPLAPALIPTHPALLTGHPLHLVSTTPIHPSPLNFSLLPHTAYIPALFAPHLNAATPPAIHPNAIVHPLFQGQDPHHHSCSSQTQQLPTIKEVFGVSSYLN